MGKLVFLGCLYFGSYQYTSDFVGSLAVTSSGALFMALLGMYNPKR